MKSLKIAVTGGIGSGKSTVCNIIKENGYKCISADEISHSILAENEVKHTISRLFSLPLIDGEIDKKALAQIVFSSESERKKLNEYIHPLIIKRIEEDINSSGENIVFTEVPLLFECGLQNFFDFTIVVMRKLNDRVSAICLRDGCTEKEAYARINSQFDYDNADLSKHIIIHNYDDYSSLVEKVRKVLQTIEEKV